MKQIEYEANQRDESEYLQTKPQTTEPEQEEEIKYQPIEEVEYLVPVYQDSYTRRKAKSHGALQLIAEINSLSEEDSFNMNMSPENSAIGAALHGIETKKLLIEDLDAA